MASTAGRSCVRSPPWPPGRWLAPAPARRGTRTPRPISNPTTGATSTACWRPPRGIWARVPETSPLPTALPPASASSITVSGFGKGRSSWFPSTTTTPPWNRCGWPANVRARACASTHCTARAPTWAHSGTGVKLPLRLMAGVLEEINRHRDPAGRVLLSVDAVHGFGVEDVDARTPLHSHGGGAFLRRGLLRRGRHEAAGCGCEPATRPRRSRRRSAPSTNSADYAPHRNRSTSASA